MKTTHTNRLIVFLLALVMMFGMVPMTAHAAGGSESDPVIVSTFAALKEAMEDSAITYVQLNATTAMIPVAEDGSSWGISAISIKGTKVLILNGNSTFTSRISGPVHNFFRLSGSNLTIQGKGKLSYEAARVNGTNALAYLEAGSTLTVDDPDITLYGGYNSAVVHGRAIYVTNGTVNISAGVFQGVSAYSEAATGLSAVYLSGGATANISGGTFGYTTVEYTPTTPYPALCIDDTLGVVSLSGGTYENGIKVPKGKTINDYLATGCSYNTSDTGTVTVTNPYLLNNLSATVTNPVAGATPATAATSGDSSKYSVTVQGWYKGGTVSSPGTEVGSSEKFEAGEAYTVKLLFTPKPLYEIKAGAYVNINKTTAYHFGSTPTTHVYTKTFEVPANLSATVTVPVAGATPATAATSGDSSKYSVTVQGWYKGGTVSSPGTVMGSNDKFTAGETYIVRLMFNAKSPYEITLDSTATINGQTAHFDAYNAAGNYYYCLAFTVSAAAPVSSFEIADLTAPVHGVAADYSASVTNTGFTVKSIRYGIRTTGLTSGDPYTGKAGDNLEIGVTVEASDGYTFSTTPTPYWNGIEGKSYKMVSMPDNQRYFVFKYTVPAAETTEVTSVSATVTAPVAGAHPDYTAVSGDSDKYTATVEYWVDSTSSLVVIQAGDTFVGGRQYKAFVNFTPKDGYTFSSSLTASINSQSAAPGSSGDPDEHLFGVEFTVPAAHTHSYTGAWKSDATNHWQLCSCGEKGNTAAHTYGAWKVTKAATETADGSRERVCAVCGYKQTEVIPMLSHTHSYTGAWKSDATNHWQLCSCGEKGNTAAHTYGAWKVTKAATETADGSRERTCAVCGYKQTEVIPMLSHTHAYGTEWKNDDSQHWHECDCGDKSDLAAHTYGEWTVTKEASEAEEGSRERVCSACGYKQTEVIPMLSHTHAYGTEWKNDDTQHWHECDCGDKSGLAAHTYGGWTVTKEATATAEGLKNRTCSACGYEEYEAIPALGVETTPPVTTTPVATDTASPDTSTSSPDTTVQNPSDTSSPDTGEPTTTDPAPTDPEKPDDSFPWWIIIVALVVCGGAAAAIIIIKKKKSA